MSYTKTNEHDWQHFDIGVSDNVHYSFEDMVGVLTAELNLIRAERDRIKAERDAAVARLCYIAGRRQMEVEGLLSGAVSVRIDCAEYLVTRDDVIPLMNPMKAQVS